MSFGKALSSLDGKDIAGGIAQDEERVELAGRHRVRVGRVIGAAGQLEGVELPGDQVDRIAVEVAASR